MKIKTKLGMVAASGALGLALISGGTYAFFNSKVEATSTFEMGTLDLSVNPSTIVSVKNLLPGDYMTRSFNLKNTGTVDIAKVLLKTEYTVTNKDGAPANTDDLGKHIRVNFLFNQDKAALGTWLPEDQVVFQTTLYDLQNMTPDAVENRIFHDHLEEIGGLKKGDKDKLFVQFEFVDNGEDQNQFQGDSLALKWTFEGTQPVGKERKN
ncbi:TasA family protein [Neobacillus massiliamazoniensis]|uniref:Camelysin n=1 Tax=Neobacillus massiliamazoniensis TaxID=1499688 RepID=A0A0U1NYG4_9BACI|nr:TasA family protein [Neobacillus massiliamazoniensis]CRK83065.1 camelysin [Neobacillus massiliamazoniensis]